MQGGTESQLAQQVGKQLRRAREKQGASLKELEQAISIHAYHLGALERGDLEALPNRAWARGFLSSYANYLGLDGEALADSVFPLQRPPRPVRYVKSRWRGLVAVMGTLAVATTLVFALTIVVPYNAVSEKVTDALNRIAPGLFLESGPQRIVVLGVPDTRVAGTDNVLAIKIAQDDSGLLVIPGNTVIEVPGYDERQIGDAFAIGGPNLTRQTVARLSGTEIPHYLLIDAQGIKDVVEAMGGLQIDVPESISGRAVPGGPIVTLSQGPQTLNGDETLVYLQGSYLEDDVSQARRQQDLLTALFGQALAPETLIFEPATLSALFESVDTNMSSSEAVQLAIRFRTVRGSGVSLDVSTVPGHREEANSQEVSAYDWVPDPRQLSAVLKNTVQ